MKTSSSKPTVTSKWPLEVPTHQYESLPTLFKVWFGKKYLIWKGKSLLQSCEQLSESIERYTRVHLLTQNPDETNQMHHVSTHIKKARCVSATVEVIDNSFMRSVNGGESINGYSLLVEEQKLLDKSAKDPLCLNNNVQAYIPKWITAAHEAKFFEFYHKKKR